MKKSVEILFLGMLLFSMSFVSAVPDCRDHETDNKDYIVEGVYYLSTFDFIGFIWGSEDVCQDNDVEDFNVENAHCIVEDISGIVYNYTLGDVEKDWPRIWTGGICREEVDITPAGGCGDMVVQVEEDCDDGNTITGDGCDENCLSEFLCSSPTQTMFSLYQTDNSHVAFWNDSNYNYKICYDEYFGSSYDGSNPHDCSVGNSNAIFWLTNTTNSHVSAVETTEYNIPVCYGELSCSVRQNTCNVGETNIATLYDTSNSHVAISDYIGYDYKVCCTDAESELIWQDMNGEEITQANVGDSVMAVLTNAGSGSFEIIENDPIENDEIRTINGVSVGGNVIGVWTITQGDLDKTFDYDGFFFRINGEDSGNLTILEDDDDSPISITFTTPACGSNYSQGTDMDMQISVFDADDLISGELTISGNKVGNLTNGINYISHSFDESGNIALVAYAENDRADKQQLVSNIMITNPSTQEKYTAACIDEPKNFDSSETSTVYFRADSSAAIDCLNGVCQRLEHDSKELKYIWSFSTCVGSVCDGFSKFGNNRVAYSFTYPYPYPGNNWAKLDVQLV